MYELVGKRYAIKKVIGQGSDGIVYEGFDTKLKRKIAAKLLNKWSESNSKKLLSEAQTLASLSHPGIVQVFDTIEEQGQA